MMFLLMANEDDVLRWMMYFEGVQLKKGARRDSERAKNLRTFYRHRVSTQFSCKTHDPLGGAFPSFSYCA